MSQLFEGYERQYCELSANLSRKCNSAAAFPDGADKKKQELSELQAELADVLIWKMDIEARRLQPSVKATLLAKLREYKSDLNKLKREVKKLAMPSSIHPAHEDLLESGLAGGYEEKKKSRLCKMKNPNDLDDDLDNDYEYLKNLHQMHNKAEMEDAKENCSRPKHEKKKSRLCKMKNPNDLDDDLDNDYEYLKKLYEMHIIAEMEDAKENCLRPKHENQNKQKKRRLKKTFSDPNG